MGAVLVSEEIAARVAPEEYGTTFGGGSARLRGRGGDRPRDR